MQSVSRDSYLNQLISKRENGMVKILLEFDVVVNRLSSILFSLITFLKAE